MLCQVCFLVPCEQRLHFRGMSWCAKSSLCRQPFSFLSRIRQAIRKKLHGSSNLREFRWNQTCENYLRTTLLELLFCFFCFAPSGFKYFSRKISTDRLCKESIFKLSTVVSPVCFAGSTFNFKRQFFRLITNNDTLKRFLSQSKRSLGCK